MRIHAVQHVEFEEPGTIVDWALERGHEFAAWHPYRGDALPYLGELDRLDVMGGPMSVRDEDAHPWLSGEKDLIRRAVNAGSTVLGVCLGAQLMADALGARVYRGRDKEIGFFPGDISREAASSVFAGLPERLDAFHWHAETFDTPPGATCLARTEAFENQAFAKGRRLLGMQFHLEPADRNVRLMIEHCGDDIYGGRFVQTADEMLAAPADVFRRMRRAMFKVLDNLSTGGSPDEAGRKGNL